MTVFACKNGNYYMYNHKKHQKPQALENTSAYDVTKGEDWKIFNNQQQGKPKKQKEQKNKRRYTEDHINEVSVY